MPATDSPLARLLLGAGLAASAALLSGRLAVSHEAFSVASVSHCWNRSFSSCSVILGVFINLTRAMVSYRGTVTRDG